MCSGCDYNLSNAIRCVIRAFFTFEDCHLEWTYHFKNKMSHAHVSLHLVLKIVLHD